MCIGKDPKRERRTRSRLRLDGLLLGLLVAAPLIAADQARAEALSIDDLFGGPPPAAPGPQAPAGAATPSGAVPAAASVAAAPASAAPAAPALTGFFQNDLAYTYAGDTHWSRFANTLDLAAQGRRGGIGWKLGGRATYDPIYDLTDHYPRAVRRDQRFEASIREAYADVSAGDWEFRLGRQHIVWGEMVGLFFADVVSAKDMRQFVLPDFDMIRIPQWAARAEYFRGDFHAEGIWIPVMTYDRIGKPGAEFHPFNPPAVPGMQTVFAKEKKPVGLDEAGYGLRLSWLKNGWDVSAFHYSSNDPSAAFLREADLTTITYRPVHQRIHQTGATLAKDLGPLVLKAEAVHTRDRLYTTLDASDADGVVAQNTLDSVVGLEWSFPEDTRVNVQLFQRWFPDHVAGLVPEKTENGVSLLLSTQALHPRLEPELLLIRSLNRDDWLGQFKLTWTFDGNWRLAAGVDVFDGPPTGLFGTYDDRDRVYTELRYTF